MLHFLLDKELIFFLLLSNFSQQNSVWTADDESQFASGQ